MDTYLALKKRYAFLQQDFAKTLNLVKNTVKEDSDYKPTKQMLDNMELLSHYLSILQMMEMFLKRMIMKTTK